MKWLLFLFLILLITSCGPKKTPVADKPVATIDTAAIVLHDAVQPDSSRIADSLIQLHNRDSLYAIKPIRIFTTDGKGDCYDKMIAATIDTLNASMNDGHFIDTFFNKYNKNGDLVSVRYVYKNKPFIIEVLDADPGNYDKRKIFIDGAQLIPGKNMDVSITDDYATSIYVNGANFLKFGNKEYLYVTGGISMCNGMGCGIFYYILYDPAIKKAMLIRQLRTDFVRGYDTNTESPVFIKMSEEGYDDELACFHYSGKAYRFDGTGKVKKLLDKKGNQYYFNGYSKADNYDSIFILSGNFRH
jgi:hypothetical protein